MAASTSLQTRKNDGGHLIPVIVSEILEPVTIAGGGAGGAVTVVQPTHDNLNANANIQVNNSDASLTNPVPGYITPERVSPNIHEPAANTAAIVTLAAAAGTRHVLGLLTWSYDDDPTGGSLTFQHGVTTLFKVDITSGGPGFFQFNPPILGDDGVSMTFTLTAGGAGISGIVSVISWTL